jgi:hypothetical protein
MRRKLALTIALAVLGACVAAGSAIGQGGSVVGVGEGGVQINVPEAENLEDVQVLPQCSNTADDDGDGLTDTGDPDCSGALDATESGTSGEPAPPAPPEPPPTDSGETSEGGSTGGGTTGGGGSGTSGGGASPADSGYSGSSGSAVSGASTDSGGGGGGDGGKPDRRDEDGDDVDDQRKPMGEPAIRTPDGAPTDANPSLTIADFGPAPIGVPNFVIDQFTIPPFLLPIYQACGTQYGIPWQVLASINRIETAFGTNLNVSSAGALGWMQFMPATWRAYGVDANSDGRKDPYNPVDAICAAARYLRASGGQSDLAAAIFAYNHADWYVDEVLLYAHQYGRLPDDLVGSLTGLTEGARFPVAADARYADDISERRALKRSRPGKRAYGNAAEVISSSPTRRGIDIYSREAAPVVAVNDGVITDIGKSKELGRYVVLRDAYGNRFTYAKLGSVPKAYPVPKEREARAAPKVEPEAAPEDGAGRRATGPVNTEDARERLYAFPERMAPRSAAPLDGSIDPVDRYLERVGYESFKAQFGVLEFDPEKTELRPLQEGSKVIAGTVLGRIGKVDEVAPRLHFAIRPSGRGAPAIDPKPILDGWKLLEATHIYRALGKDPFERRAASSGQVLLLSKEQAIREVLSDPRVGIYECGRTDIRTGQIDVRVMRLLLYLARSGFRPTVTSLKCGHSLYTSSGSISHHSTGTAVDIAQINGLPILGNQGSGSITEAVIQRILELQGTMVPDQVISLMAIGGPTFAMSDHADHIHVGYAPGPAGTTDPGAQLTRVLEADQWRRLIARLGEIDNPSVPSRPSRYAEPTKRNERASAAHKGE